MTVDDKTARMIAVYAVSSIEMFLAAMEDEKMSADAIYTLFKLHSETIKRLVEGESVDTILEDVKARQGRLN